MYAAPPILVGTLSTLPIQLPYLSRSYTLPSLSTLPTQLPYLSRSYILPSLSTLPTQLPYLSRSYTLPSFSTHSHHLTAIMHANCFIKSLFLIHISCHWEYGNGQATVPVSINTVGVFCSIIIQL